jgi:hypothetical protein
LGVPINCPSRYSHPQSKRKEFIIKKVLMMLIFTLFLVATAGTVFGEEMAKEGAIIGKNYLSGTSKVLAMGQERLQMNYEGGGVIVDDTGKGFSHLAAGYIMGTLHAVKCALRKLALWL